MSIRPLVAMHMLILTAVATGCGSSAEPKSDSESLVATRNAAPQRNTAEEQPVEKKAAEEKVAKEEAAKEEAAEKRADEKKAAEEKAAANSYIKVKFEVELRGVLTCTGETVTILIYESEFDLQFPKEDKKEHKWELDFCEDKPMRANAKDLVGKTVLVKGIAVIRGIKTIDYEKRARGLATDWKPLFATKSVFDFERKVAVKSLIEAIKE